MANKKKSAAPNPTVKYAKIAIDEETYSLAFDFNAIAVAEEVSGVNLMKALSNLNDLSASQFRGLLYAALIKAQPEIAIEEVGQLINLTTMAPLQLALAEAYINSMPEPKAENPQQPVEAA
jgi:hypothetical protein